MLWAAAVAPARSLSFNSDQCAHSMGFAGTPCADSAVIGTVATREAISRRPEKPGRAGEGLVPAVKRPAGLTSGGRCVLLIPPGAPGRSGVSDNSKVSKQRGPAVGSIQSKVARKVGLWVGKMPKHNAFE